MERFLFIEGEITITVEAETPEQAFKKAKKELNCRDYTHYKVSSSYFGYFQVFRHNVKH